MSTHHLNFTFRVTALLLSFASAVYSQEQPAEVPASATLSRTLVIEHDRDLEVRLRSIQTALANQDHVAAIQTLGELLAIPEPPMVQVGNVYRDARFEAERVLRTGTRELREAFLRETEVRAQEEARIARESGDLPSLLAVAERYPFTPVANEALLALMEQFYDMGRFDAAVTCGRQLIENQPNPAAIARAYPLAIRLWRDALRELKLPDEAAELEQRWPIDPQTVSPFRDPPLALNPLVADNVPVQPWRIDAESPSRAGTLLRNVVSNLRRDGIQVGLFARPLVLSDRTIWRTFTELICFDHRTGTVIWRQPLPSQIAEEVNALTDRADPATERRLGRELGQRVQRDSVLGKISADAERVYVVVDILPANEVRPDGISLTPACTLIAFSLQSGEELWRTSEVWAKQDAEVTPLPEGPKLPPAPQGKAVPAPSQPPHPYFFGPPSVTGGNLYILGQAGESLLLFGINPQTGESLGASPLGDCADLLADRRRLSQACPILWYDGLAICATGAGAIVAFDPFANRVKWAYRYGRDDQQVESTGLLQPSARRDGWQWLHGWQEAQINQADGKIVAVSPESDAIHCLSAVDGSLLWTISLEQGRRLVAVHGGRVVITGPTFVRSYRLADGTEEAAFTLTTPIVAAHWRDESCEITLSSGETIDWSPVTREIRPITPQSLRPLRLRPAGTLDPINGFAVRQLFYTFPIDSVAGSDHITVWPDRIERHKADLPIEREFAHLATDDPTDSAPLTKLQQDLDRLAATTRETQVQRVLIPLLSLLNQQPTQWEVDLVEIETGPSTPRRSSRTVRLDAYLRGRLQSLWEGATPADREAILATYSHWAAASLDESGPPLLEPLEFLSTRVLDRPLKWTSLAELAQQQLALRRRHLLSNRDDAARALWRLGEMHAERGDWRDAATIYAELRERLPHVTLSGGQTIVDLVKGLPADSPLAKRIGEDLRTTWPDRAPTVTTKEAFESREMFAPIPVTAERGSLFDHLNLATETIGGQTLRFSGLGRSRPWMVTLPKSNRDWRAYLELRKAWGFGQFVVVQYGSEIFCVSGLNAKGEASSKSSILWPTKGTSVDTLGNTDNMLLASELQPVPQPVGFARPAAERFDAHGHRSTWVGPVTPGIVCYLEQGMLVCRETATGRELWRRYDILDGVKSIGDDRVIVLQRDGQTNLELLNPADGSTLRHVAWSHMPEECLRTWGRRVLVASGQPMKGQLLMPPPQPDQAARPPLKLEMVDLAGPTTLWSAEYPPGSAAFEVDEEWLGVLHPDGRVLFLDVITGAVISESPVAWPPGLLSIAAGVTERSIHVTLSSAITEKGLTEPLQTQQGWRRPAVNGLLASFDRRTGKLNWTRAIDHRIVPQDQPRDVPLIVCADVWQGKPPALEKTLPPSKQPAPKTPPIIWKDVKQSRYYCLDARTGETLYEETVQTSMPYYTIERDLAAEWVELRLGFQKTRFDYSRKAPTGSSP